MHAGPTTPSSSSFPGRHLTLLWRDESAATAVEYALIASAVAAVIAVVVIGLGGKLVTLYRRVDNDFPGP